MEEVSRKRSSTLKGRWPKDFFTRLGYFKAEECSRFVMYCLPHILYEARYDVETTIGQLGTVLIEIARMFYIVSRTAGGWTEEMIGRGRMLLASWHIRSEEKLGANSSIFEHVAGVQQKIDSLSGMQLLETRERFVEADNWRPVNQLGHHFMPLFRRGYNEIFALELSDSRRRGHMFNIGAIGFPSPFPVVNDVMLASHLPSCQIRTTDTCIIREVLLPENTIAVTEIEDDLSDDDISDGNLVNESVDQFRSENISVDEEESEFRPAALSRVQVQWLKNRDELH
ncbi:hypothetical protein R1sor_009344 [Riccia sorocarpa]|uniref:Uncharacterized protein n=1 Tax=Riccia sorocarpa TaxID=122646 RepID=A0ABD3HUV7_9MARC